MYRARARLRLPPTITPGGIEPDRPGNPREQNQVVPPNRGGVSGAPEAAVKGIDGVASRVVTPIVMGLLLISLWDISVQHAPFPVKHASMRRGSSPA